MWTSPNCRCVLCEEEKNNPDDEKYQEFDKISKKLMEFKSERENDPVKITHDKLKREILCYKEMYKFANEKQASIQYILRNILVPG